ncbi:P-loop NTPase fold protein [Pantoea sp. Ep11b]|uniref:P-loop NTPase fold protein n=1 Tax=Pantoea sp. Ep11b TaxID=3141459 RepID=UPI00345FBE10
MAQTNNPVDEYLNFYNALEKPGFAVLVRGEWGSGKTHKIKELFQENMYYVSLFGLTSQKEIYSSVFLSMFPLKAKAKGFTSWLKESLDGSEALTFGAGNILSGISDALIKEEVANDKVIVFDDLERADVDINEILGVVNKYVEHHLCKVIVIAHDEKVNEKFNETKEKVFGQILQVTPDIVNTLHFFASNCGSPAAAREILPYIQDVFIASKCQSLRILKHVLNDCLRLYDCLNAEHLKHKESIKKLFTVFSAFSISFRSGVIKKEDMNNRVLSFANSLREKKDVELSSYEKMKARFKSEAFKVEFESTIVSDEILVDTICNGYFDKRKIINHLNDSLYFSLPKEFPSWKILINFDELDDHTIAETIKKLQEEEKSFSITDDGDILHTFSMKCLMAISGEINSTPSIILQETKDYINTLLRCGRLTPEDKNLRESYSYDDHSHGYGYWVREEYKTEFNEIKEHLNESKKTALLNEYPSIAGELIYDLENNIDYFKIKISRDSNKLGIYSQIPVLTEIAPEFFVDKWLELPVSNWTKVREALEYRYDTGMLRNSLGAEVKWITAVCSALECKANQCTGFSKLRISRLKPKFELPESVANVSH